MRVFAVSGYSGTGKTSLIEAIIRSLVESGHSVATLKSSIHDVGPDQGTDTWKHRKAGASMTIFLGLDTRYKSLKDKIGPEELERISEHDFLIIEGLKSVNVPRFWCIGDRELVLDDVPTNTRAIVSWTKRETDVIGRFHVISMESIDELVDIVKTSAVNFNDIE
jgi:molybdopterin-guanine dinucleotide biosynthesis protein B